MTAINFSKFIENRISFSFKRYKHANLSSKYLIIFMSGIVASLYLSLALVSRKDIGLSLVFFGLSVLFCITVLSEFTQPLINKIDELQMALREVNKKLDDIELNTERAIEHIKSLKDIKQRPGFVYIMRRDDGIIKIGRSVNIEKRLKQHIADYGHKFAVIETFAVPDTIAFEYLALSMTANHSFSEPHRNELRFMSDKDIETFRVTFTTICKEAVILR
jgi:hypothetical protein